MSTSSSVHTPQCAQQQCSLVSPAASSRQLCPVPACPRGPNTTLYCTQESAPVVYIPVQYKFSVLYSTVYCTSQCTVQYSVLNSTVYCTVQYTVQSSVRSSPLHWAAQPVLQSPGDPPPAQAVTQWDKTRGKQASCAGCSPHPSRCNSTVGKSPPFTKIASPFDPMKRFRCPWRFRFS